jgi:multiple RNA-binding domain-containing protein 1
VEAFKGLDGRGFQGRLLHIIPAAPKRETKLNEFEISKLPLKKQRELKRKASAATSQFNWNSMYMNVIKSISIRTNLNNGPVLMYVCMVGRCCDVLRGP